MNEELKNRQLATHKAINKHFADLAQSHADLTEESETWTTTDASASIAYVFAYLQLDCNLKFSDGLRLIFNGKGLVAGLGATGSLGGQATFNVDPRTLIDADGITFEAFALGVGVGGFQVTWYHDHRYIGHGEFYGAGVTLGTPGGGWGTFKEG